MQSSTVIILQYQIKLFPRRQTLDSSKPKEFVDDNLNFNEIGRKFFKRVENTVGKIESASNERFLLFPLCFQKIFIADT